MQKRFIHSSGVWQIRELNVCILLQSWRSERGMTVTDRLFEVGCVHENTTTTAKEHTIILHT